MFPVPSSRYLFGNIPIYSVLIVLGAAIAIVLAVREEKRIHLKKDTVIDLSLWLLPFGIIGARIYYVAFSWDQFKNDLLSVFRIWEGGIAIYGAVIAGLVVVLLFSRKRKIHALTLCDIIVPGLVLAQAIGRWGNYFNMEAYGLPISNPALCFFPFAVYIPSDSAWHMATFFYESCCNLIIFIFLVIARRKLFRKRGDVFFFYSFLYACGRLVIEDFRMDSLYAGSSIRVSQLLSVLICVCIMIYFTGTRSPKGSFIKRLICGFSALISFPVLAYALNIFIHPDQMTVLSRFIFLGIYSLLNVILLFLIYGKSEKKEVLYALHKV